MTFWAWNFLSQKTPTPEKYLLGALEAVLDNPFEEGSFGPEVKAEYMATRVHPELDCNHAPTPDRRTGQNAAAMSRLLGNDDRHQRRKIL